MINGDLDARFERLTRLHKSIFSDDWADRLETSYENGKEAQTGIGHTVSPLPNPTARRTH